MTLNLLNVPLNERQLAIPRAVSFFDVPSRNGTFFVLTNIPTGWYSFSMPRRTKQDPERGEARTRLLEAARDVIRAQGFCATRVDDLCKTAGVTKGAFFHHFESKDALGVAAAAYWAETTNTLFAGAPYHDHDDPLDRILAYVEFRRTLIDGTIAEWTCLVGTLAQEVHETHPEIREACAASIFGHADTLVPDIEAAIAARNMRPDWSAQSLARHTQAVLQGAFILAKASGDRDLALESVDHLKRYIMGLFSAPSAEGKHHDARAPRPRPDTNHDGASRGPTAS